MGRRPYCPECAGVCGAEDAKTESDEADLSWESGFDVGYDAGLAVGLLEGRRADATALAAFKDFLEAIYE